MQNDVALRDVIESDLPIFFEHQADPVACKMAAFPSRPRQAFMEHWQKIMADEEVILRTILYREQVAGIMMSFMQGSKRQVGYWIGRKFWGKGITSQALEEFLKQIKMRPLYAHVAKHNNASLRVLEKCGFKITGHEPGSMWWESEPVEDLVLALDA